MAVIEARGSSSDDVVGDIMANINVVAEQYPDLKTNQSFLELQKKLTALEDELAAARRTYNAAVTEYNTTLESFPTNLVGKLMRKKNKRIVYINKR